ncbi:hypothetical protein [Desulfovibrio sp.]|uniref:hypothetical protein n=1 Tax=Desulfovibrio sp. TaxID=885 RepID=UPI0025BA2A32|nr:hypothetical protein [Desulfovibrio sp.]
MLKLSKRPGGCETVFPPRVGMRTARGLANGCPLHSGRAVPGLKCVIFQTRHALKSEKAHFSVDKKNTASPHGLAVSPHAGKN